MGGRLTLTLKYQFSLILESAGQKVFFACFHVFFSYYETLSLLQHGNLEGVLFKEIATDILEPGLPGSQSQLFRLNTYMIRSAIYMIKLVSYSQCLSQLD